jgi:hypothetical protein
MFRNKIVLGEKLFFLPTLTIVSLTTPLPPPLLQSFFWKAAKPQQTPVRSDCVELPNYAMNSNRATRHVSVELVLYQPLMKHAMTVSETSIISVTLT